VQHGIFWQDSPRHGRRIGDRPRRLARFRARRRQRRPELRHERRRGRGGDGRDRGGRRACPVRSADLTDAVAVEALFAAARDRFGQVDVLVANAGGLLKRSRCVDTDPDFWEQAIALNLTSAFLCCRAALTEMEPRGSGAIVLMSSLAAFDGGGPGASHYAAAKGALVSYTRALAKEVGPLGIRVNGVAPGLIGTRFHDVFNTPEGRRTTVERTPLRREGTPDDVAETILFLASPRASFLTGETVQINGGLGMF
jgi:3-oxoacyl-[acyl-carrier protein] reductase